MKKLLVTVLTTVLVASMVACGSKNDVVTETTETITTETVETETTEMVESEVTTEAEATDGTAGQILLAAFREMMAANPEMTAQEAADALIANEIIQFMGGTMPVEEGLLGGFDNAEITGFEEATAFMPMMGSIPFVGYIFDMPEDADLEAFMTTLKDNANMRWQICVEAEEMVVEAIDDKVFFLMCKKDLSAE